MSDLHDDWLDYEGLSDLAAENQLANPPEGTGARIHQRLMAAIGAPVMGVPEALDGVDSTADVVELVRGVGEAVSTAAPSAGAISSAAAPASVAISSAAAPASVASVGVGATVSGGTAVGTSALGAKGLALLLTIAGGGAAVTVAVHDAPTVETSSVAVSSSPTAPSTSRAKPSPAPLPPMQPAASAVTVETDSPAVAQIEGSTPSSTFVESTRRAPTVTPRRLRPIPRQTTPAVPPAPAIPARDGALLAEQALLRAARRAIAQRDIDGALISIRHHEIAHPDGRLTQERELLRVQALARAGRVGEAEAAAARFRSRFPESLMTKALEYALNPDAGVR
jgi:hypothetical protein